MVGRRSPFALLDPKYRPHRDDSVIFIGLGVSNRSTKLNTGSDSAQRSAQAIRIEYNRTIGFTPIPLRYHIDISAWLAQGIYRFPTHDKDGLPLSAFAKWHMLRRLSRTRQRRAFIFLGQTDREVNTMRKAIDEKKHLVLVYRVGSLYCSSTVSTREHLVGSNVFIRVSEFLKRGKHMWRLPIIPARSSKRRGRPRNKIRR